ncbi:MAG: flagellar hook-associated protein FlgL [Deltaproteobacteria bacterium]|nr:flagellar hook-associated protein FlgL [Deltaproteobacteria bacterium]
MRVTDAQITRSFIAQIYRQRNALIDVQREVSSGIRVANPSDDPAHAGTIAQFQSSLQRFEQHKERMSYVTNLLQQQESILASSGDLLIRARELAQQGANETLSEEQRRTLGDEVFQLRDALVSLANSKVQGRYIYGGADDDDPPFDSATYVNPATGAASERWVFDSADAGQDVTREVSITDSLSVRVSTSGQDVFENSIAALERLGRALTGYRTEPEDLSTLPDGNGVAFNFPAEYQEQTEDILEALDLVESGADEVKTERASIGSRLSRVQVASEIMDIATIDTQTARQAVQDADIFEAASKLANFQTNLEATLASGAQLSRLSLMDFI